MTEHELKSNKNNELTKTLTQDLQKLAADGVSDDKPVRKIPPLERWQPERSSPIDIEIRDNGEWWHEGTKMTRQSLVDLFASVLWVEMYDGQKVHYLKTPTDKYQIRVADAPLFINQVDQVSEDGQLWIEFGTTNGDRIRLDDDHTLYFKAYQGEERLYIDTRFGLSARLMNNAMYHLIEMGELVRISEDKQNKTVLKLSSGGKIHQIDQHA